ncbi:hypothetical protein LY632_08160 [Erythrobacter sp. SDW2]|uniref:hypothetical protein n=1 Tax=Erythrobacter sp. SDW2 TaxID=2907154 RepID=UPI001F3C408C|nr:hypothetical protein [Erythrobacter sp. SDW2]UIP05686.1 hypothetical protein LY632_08160 [Erythrobacter sp. SDW2]
MIGPVLLLAMQMIQTLPPPTAEVTTPAQWNCTFDRANDESFWLGGTFPEVPAGWDVNTAMPTSIEGNGPAPLIGKVEMKPFSANALYRRYYVVARAPEGGHYNMMFLLLADDTGMATIEKWTPGTNGEPGTIRAFATGRCDATFGPADDGGAGQ